MRRVRDMQGFGIALARLGGADPNILARTKRAGDSGASKEQARFGALGLVLIATASLAALSMAFAMTDGLHVGLTGAVVLGVFWGMVILVADRALILSLKPDGSKLLVLATILPRILIAALLGLVISTPLTLKIFDDEIQQQMTRQHREGRASVRGDLSGRSAEAPAGPAGGDHHLETAVLPAAGVTS
jgi:hypothetical protein